MHKLITDKDLKSLISKKLILLRQKSRKTLEEIASDLNLDYVQYCRLLKGLRLPHLVTLANISRFYNVNIDWWFQELTAQDKARANHKSIEFELMSNFRKLDMRAKEMVTAMLGNLTQKKKIKNRSR
jgi:transcriptional regulator with XRE-family HTH domain